MGGTLRSLDLFAGHGWGVACDWLGIQETGVEIMPEAVATRDLNGMTTAYNDVWQGLLQGTPRIEYDLLIASPPCQTFSAAGSGTGRKAADQVLWAIANGDYMYPSKLHALGERTDPRTALVLTPLAHIWRDNPKYVVLEQVPYVRIVWEAYAVLMREWGYSVWVGNLNAEQYGVPQTRKRAVLIARRDGKEAKQPKPTHSQYYPRSPERLDPGVAPWVSMATALKWGMPERPSYTLTSGGVDTGGYEPFPTGARQGMAREQEEGRWVFAGAGATAQETSRQRPREAEEPAHTVTGARSATWVLRSNYGTNGNSEERGEREETQPAPTVTSKVNRNVWFTRPATTVAADDRIAGPGRSEFIKGGTSRQNRPGTVRVTVEEAAALQSYPEDFKFAGSNSKRFLQIGNAVPPLLAKAILEEILS